MRYPRKVGCPARTSNLSCLKSVRASRLSAAAYDVTRSFSRTQQLGLLPFMPVQDFQADGFWFSAPARTLVNNGQFATVPVIAGYTLDEGTGGAPKNLQNGQQFADWVRRVTFADTSNARLTDRVLSNILRLFPKDVNQGSPFPNRPTGASAGTTDTADPYFSPAWNQFKRAASFYAAWRYTAPHHRFLRQRHAARSSGIWSYVFAQHDRHVQAWRGVTHSAELPYVFGIGAGSGLYPPLSKTIQRAWISFVNFHDPRPD
ncbi:hypothetical protein V8E36_009794 [Tilletia maclaganii]